MNEQLKVLAFARSESVAEQLRHACAGLSGATVDVAIQPLEQVTRRFVNSHDAVLVDLESLGPSARDQLKRTIESELKDLPVLVSANDATLEQIREILSYGVVDVLSTPLRQTDLAVAIEHIARRQVRAQPSGGSSGKVIAFIKGGGGVGASTLAVQGGCVLAAGLKGKKQPRVCLLDFDIQFGTAGLYLDLQAPVGLPDVLGSPERLDGDLLRGAMSHHASGLDVLQSPREMVSLDDITPEFATEVLRVAGQTYDYVLIDLCSAWTPWTYTILDQADYIVLVTQLTLAGVRQSLRQIETMKANGLATSNLRLVLNRHSSSWRLGRSAHLKDAEKTLNARFDFILPSDFRLVSEAIDRGVPLSTISKRSPFYKAVRDMFRALCVDLEARPMAHAHTE